AAATVGGAVVGTVIGHGAVLEQQVPAVEDAAAVAVIGLIVLDDVLIQQQVSFVVEAAARTAGGVAVFDDQVEDGNGGTVGNGEDFGAVAATDGYRRGLVM